MALKYVGFARYVVCMFGEYWINRYMKSKRREKSKAAGNRGRGPTCAPYAALLCFIVLAVTPNSSIEIKIESSAGTTRDTLPFPSETGPLPKSGASGPSSSPVLPAQATTGNAFKAAHAGAGAETAGGGETREGMKTKTAGSKSKSGRSTRGLELYSWAGVVLAMLASYLHRLQSSYATLISKKDKMKRKMSLGVLFGTSWLAAGGFLGILLLSWTILAGQAVTSRGPASQQVPPLSWTAWLMVSIYIAQFLIVLQNMIDRVLSAAWGRAETEGLIGEAYSKKAQSQLWTKGKKGLLIIGIRFFVAAIVCFCSSVKISGIDGLVGVGLVTLCFLAPFPSSSTTTDLTEGDKSSGDYGDYSDYPFSGGDGAKSSVSGVLSLFWGDWSSVGHAGFVQQAQRFCTHVRRDSKSSRVAMFLAVNIAFMLLELLYGLWSNSLGLISDAGHMMMDCMSLVIGLLATYMAQFGRDPHFTYGYGRFEVVSGYTNGVLLLFVAFFIFIESVGRLSSPPDIQGDKLVLVSVAGLLINLVGLAFFHEHAHGHSHSGGCGHDHRCGGGSSKEPHKHSHSHNHSHSPSHSHGHSDEKQSCSHGKHHSHHHHNHHHQASKNRKNKSTVSSLAIRGIFLHVLADTLGSLGVIVSSYLVNHWGWSLADPVCSLCISLLILVSVIPLLQESTRILLQKQDTSIQREIERAANQLTRLNGVVSYRAFHSWSVGGSGADASLKENQVQVRKQISRPEEVNMRGSDNAEIYESYRHDTEAATVITLHVQVEDDADPEEVLMAAKAVFENANIGHFNLTMQIEKQKFLSTQVDPIVLSDVHYYNPAHDL
eukprot:CAMPEP_0184485052 /NCGR_PEP_ID=MMETSP0113_2-20130426/6700_1 /TAXON_ID=91329 /ORGANISM="Norrisiella sphaerica, Strain BC52" /LENGTH=827 /DNA_ID=CAMNT_0026866323 /DNA_START=410 /DNA_END=2893 /DNA_ORIENTATION=+